MLDDKSVPFTEFDLIKTYFSSISSQDQPDVSVGIGDDAALLLPHSKQVVVATNTLSACGAKEDFPDTMEIVDHLLTPPFQQLISGKAIVQGFSLALTLPEIRHEWLEKFSDCLKQFTSDHSLTLFGGDTTQGDWAFTVVFHGYVADAR